MTTLTDTVVRAARQGVPDLTALTLASFNQTADADSFMRGGHNITVDRDNDSGRFGDDGLSDIINLASVFGRQTVAGQSVVAFEDPDGNYLEDGGKGVAFRDVDELGDIEDEHDLGEANVFTPAKAVQVADQLATAAQAARSEGTIGGLQRRATLKAAGMDIAAFNDGDGLFGEPEASYVAMGYQGHDVDWDSPNLADQEGTHFTLFDPDEADDLAEALRAAAATAAPAKTGVPRRLDRLGLDGRIPLQPGERLTGSASVDALRYSDFDPALAATAGLQGPQLRLSFVHNEELRDWTAGDDGETIVLDAAGFAQLQNVMAELPARADAQRAEYARDVIDPEEAKVAAIQARIDAIRDRQYEEHPLTAEEKAKIRELEARSDSLISMSHGWDEYVAAHRRMGELQVKYLRRDDDGTLYSDPMSDEDKAEYQRLKERTIELHDQDRNIVRIDRLSQQIHDVATTDRELTRQEKDEIADLRRQIAAVYAETAANQPGIDDLMFSGRIPGQWGDLRYEVHGSDSGWEDNPTGVGTWRLRLDTIPKGAPLDHDDRDDVQAGVEPGELRQLMRAFEKVYNTATAQTAASVARWRMPAHLRRRAAIDVRSIREIADNLEIPYELIRGRA